MLGHEMGSGKKGEAEMGTAKAKEKGGLCCPYCADSKFPCVTMEKQMRRGTESEKKEGSEKGRD